MLRVERSCIVSVPPTFLSMVSKFTWDDHKKKAARTSDGAGIGCFHFLDHYDGAESIVLSILHHMNKCINMFHRFMVMEAEFVCVNNSVFERYRI